MAGDEGFLSRWSRRKTQVARGERPEDAPVTASPPVAVAPPAVTAPVEPPAPAPEAAVPAPPPPTLDDVERLDPKAADFSRFVARDVTPEVKNAALKKLFADPHFNVMDGLDIYIDDYGQPDPLPSGMLRKLAHGRSLGLFADEEQDPTTRLPGSPAAAAPPTDNPAPATAGVEPLPNEDTDLRLQPHDAAGRQGDPAGAGEDSGSAG